MDKKLLVFYSIVVLVMLGMAAFLYFSPYDRFKNTYGFLQLQATQIFREVDYRPRYAPELNLIAGACALWLVGYLFWGLYRKFQTDTRSDLSVRENSLYEISLATGRSEYDLLHKSAEDWSISGDRIEQDYKRYMADQILPHYAKDFVRKNRLDDPLRLR